jgi:ferredoxin-nitrite reductase
VNDQAFSQEQQEYLKGFMSGVAARRGGISPLGGPVGGGAASTDPNHIAQDRIRTSGGKLVAEEDAKRRQHPLDRFDAIAGLAAEGKFPKGLDVFLTKFHGLFYVAPAQNAFMCRLRIPGGIITAHQLRGVAAIAAELGGGYADITTRANLQIREIPAEAPIEILLRLSEIGLTSRGSGADNIRNITGSPTAGIDLQELIDTRPHCRALHHFILHHRELYGLPRKFNVAFDGGGRVPVLEDTNDIAFTAVKVREGFGAAPGLYYRLGLGGITGHRDFARPTDALVPPGDIVTVSHAIFRAYLLNGNRTDRTRARLKYLLDEWGLPRFLHEVEKERGGPLTRVAPEACELRAPQDRLGHVGVHPQKQAGLFYVGVVCPVGRLSCARLTGLADIADRYGSGTLRLTVWQNLLISDIPEDRLEAALAEIAALGLDWRASPLRAGLVACTGNAGCKFSASDTKSHATRLVEWLEPRITVDRPINIHLTGCHHSCAQHYIADIGLLAAKVEIGDELVEGYDLHVGGGAGADAAIGRLIRANIVFDALPPMVLALLKAWMAQRASGEGFQAWSARQSDAALADLTAGLE